MRARTAHLLAGKWEFETIGVDPILGGTVIFSGQPMGPASNGFDQSIDHSIRSVVVCRTQVQISFQRSGTGSIALFSNMQSATKGEDGHKAGMLKRSLFTKSI